MVYITQLIYIQEGQEQVFHQFEDVALPLMAKHGGKLLLRLRPDQKSFIETETGKPYEIHLVQFPSENEFDKFMRNEERNRFLHLKEKSIESVLLIKGEKLTAS